MSEQLKRRLTDFQVVPPSRVWEDISGELASSAENASLQQRMQAYEVPPPPSSWFALHEQLKQHLPYSSGGVAMLSRRSYRVMAAAAFTGLVMLGSFYFFSRSSNARKQLVSQVPKVIKADPTESPVVSAPVPNEASVAQTLASHITHQPSTTAREKKSRPEQTTRLIRNTVITLAGFPENDEEVEVPAKPIRNERGDIIQDSKVIAPPFEKYIRVTGPNGQQTKISAKFRNLLLYLNRDMEATEDLAYFDKTFLESLVWKARFSNWRNKILENGVIPTSTNFMDIVELKELILKDKDNK